MHFEKMSSLRAQTHFHGQAPLRSQALLRTCGFQGGQAPRRAQALLRGQGTIEYLVIIAAVVVISLAVVSLFASTASSPSTQISSSVGKLGSASGGGIRVTEATIDPQGNAVVAFQNVSGEAMTITKISQEKDNTTITEVFFNEQIVSGVKSFYLTDFNKLCECTSGVNSRTCEFRITYTTANNLTKTEKVTINTQCVSNVTPKEPEKIVGLGTGTLTNPWVINSCTELQNMNQHLDGNYALGTDINCYSTSTWNLGAGFAPIGLGIGDGYFYGSLNGQNHSITGLNIYLPATDDVGLFSVIVGANIQNVNLIDATIAGNNDVGGFTGQGSSEDNPSTIDNCYFQGTVNGNLRIGGIIGKLIYSPITNSNTAGNIYGYEYVGGIAGNLFGGTISYSYNEADINGSGHIGGLVGSATTTSSISNCYNLGDVNSTQYGAGISSNLSTVSTITNSYNYGRINAISDGGGINAYTGAGSSVTASYWDSDKSGTVPSGGGAGRTTAEMTIVPIPADTYEGWDFTTIWTQTNGSYPTLR